MFARRIARRRERMRARESSARTHRTHRISAVAPGAQPRSTRGAAPARLSQRARQMAQPIVSVSRDHYRSTMVGI